MHAIFKLACNLRASVNRMEGVDIVDWALGPGGWPSTLR